MKCQSILVSTCVSFVSALQPQPPELQATIQSFRPLASFVGLTDSLQLCQHSQTILEQVGSGSAKATPETPPEQHLHAVAQQQMDLQQEQAATVHTQLKEAHALDRSRSLAKVRHIC